jgi:LacI family transcriptional regulator
VAGASTPANSSRHANGKKVASIQDVAAASGVSTATVSRVLNSPTLVSPETAQRVKSAIEKLGYKPNLFAKGLMTRRSRVVGIMLPDIHGEFYSELLRGADEEAQRQGYQLLVSSEARRKSSDKHAPSNDHELTFGIVDGLAIMLAEPNPALWKQARQSGVPITVIDAEANEPGVDSILIDNAVGATEATRHLLSSTSPELCLFVGGPSGNFDSSTRAEAFLSTLRAHKHTPMDHQVAHKEYTASWGYSWAERTHKNGRLRHAGVLCANDEIALGVLQAAQDLGLNVPRELKVIGFDDTRLASLIRPKLSSVRVPMGEVGAAAIRLLVQRIENPDAKNEIVKLSTRLVERESSCK